MKYVNICGIPHNVIYAQDVFNTDLHLDQIDYQKCEILLNSEIPKELKDEVLCHEIVHGILMHIGYDELSNDEKFVQQLGNAINQTFAIRIREQ